LFNSKRVCIFALRFLRKVMKRREDEELESGKNIFFLKKYLVDKKRVSTFAAPKGKEQKRLAERSGKRSKQ
jgi:hypothetical protein